MEPRAIIPHRKVYSIFLFFVWITTIFSCTDHSEGKMILEEMDKYVQEHLIYADKYDGQQWSDMDRVFHEKKARLDRDVNGMSEEMKQQYNDIVARWDAFSADFRSRAEASRKSSDNLFETTLFPPGMANDIPDIITTQNIAMIYEHFVAAVIRNRDVYTREEWQRIGYCWKMLNDKNDIYQNEIPKEDCRRILTQKTKYESIRVMHKLCSRKPG